MVTQKAWAKQTAQVDGEGDGEGDGDGDKKLFPKVLLIKNRILLIRKKQQKLRLTKNEVFLLT